MSPTERTLEVLEPRAALAGAATEVAVGWRPWIASARRAFSHHLAVAARVNAFAVLPTTLLLFVVSRDSGWAHLWHLGLTVFALVNSSFIVLNGFYHWFWGPFASLRSRLAYIVFGVLILPILGLAGSLLGIGVLAALDTPLPARPRSVLAVGTLASMLYGITFYTLEDARRSRRDTLLRLAAAQRRQEELERAREQAEITALQALIKPHFVFNALNSIAALVHEDPDLAEETTLRLARLMRHILEIRDGTLVSLETEAGIARSYLEIEQLRMGERLSYEISIPESLLGLPIPAMLLQPLVENAVKHGARQRVDGGHVRLVAKEREGGCEIRVLDDGPGFGSEGGTGRGMSLVRDRLLRVYGSSFEMSLERDEAAGQTVLSLVIPAAPTRGGAA